MEFGSPGNSPMSTKTAEAVPGSRETVNVALSTLPLGMVIWLEPPSMTPFTMVIGSTISKSAPVCDRALNRPSPANSSEIIVVSGRRFRDSESLSSEDSPAKIPSGSVARSLSKRLSSSSEDSPAKIPSGSVARAL